MNKDNYIIKRIFEKLEHINDPELKFLFQELLSERKKLKSEAYTDELSKLYNRKILKYIKNSSAVVMMDIDNFKYLNDHFGHHIGDYVVVEIAKIISQNIRSCDIACRYGGDEFLISFTNCHKNIVEERVQKIQNEIKNKVRFSNNPVTLSIGIAVNDCDKNMLSLINEADRAMYEAKNNGKDFISIHSKTLKKQQ